MPYIGNQHNVGDHVNNFKVLDDISSYTATFDGSATSVVSTSAETIRIPEHRFIQGQRVTYNNGGGSNIGGLTSGTAYYVSFDSANTIKLATSLANANSNNVINLSTVGGGTSHTLNASFDGINTKFKLTFGNGNSARLNNATQINVAINNVIQRPNLDANNFADGFALADNHKIVFKTAPTSQDIFWGSIISNTIENFDLRDNEVDNFTGNGSATEFNLSTIPANNESVIVTIDGVLQHPSDKNTSRAYTLLSNIIQFTAAPALNAEIQVRHIGFAGASTNDVSGFYGRTGNVTLTANDHITTGDITSRNINASGIITAASANFGGNVSIGGTLTYEDVTNVDSVGILTARSGIHIDDSITHIGDTNTKIRFPSNNNISFETNGGERLRIKTDGTVYTVTENRRFGIGQDPDATTMGATSGTWQVPEVDGQTIGSELRIGDINTGSTAVIRLASYGAGNQGVGGGAIMFTNTRNGSASFHSDIAAIKGARESLGKGYLRFFTANQAANQERLRITSEGKVGIGTDLPQEELTIMSATPALMLRDSDQPGSYTQVSNANQDMYFSANGASAHANFIFRSGNNGSFEERVRITSTGFMGVGTNNPTAPLVVSSSENILGILTSTDDGANIDLADNDTQSRIRTVDGRLHLYSDFGSSVADSSIRFFVDGDNEKVRITHDGNVGIGSENPDKKLSIVSGSNLALSIINDTGFATAGVYFEGGRNAGTGVVGDLEFYNRRTTTTSNLKVNGDGDFTFNKKVGIGTNRPLRPLHIHDTDCRIRLEDAGVATDVELQNTSGDAVLTTNGASNVRLQTNNEERLRITSVGRVGIGTNNPDELLELVGTDPKLKIHDVPAGSTHALEIGHDGTEALINLRSSGLLKIAQSNGASNGITFHTNSALNERLRITGEGKVGIGTDAPSYPLQVHDSGAGGLLRLLSGHEGNYDLRFVYQNSEANIWSYGSTDLTFGTRYAKKLHLVTNGPSKRVTISDGGYVGIGTDNPNSPLVVRNSSNTVGVFTSTDNGANIDLFDDDTQSRIRTIDGRLQFFADFTNNVSTSSIKFYIDGNSEKLQINSSGRLLFGNHLNDRGGQIQYEGSEHAGVGIHRNTNSHSSPALQFSKSRGTSAGSNTIVQNNDYLGMISFKGTDGSGLANGAFITGIVDGTPGSNDMPTRLGFWTSADGSESPTERMRIDKDGNVTKPNNAMFKAKMSASRAQTSSGWVKIQFDDDSAADCFDIGSNFDTSNHRFTAPVTGYYHFGCNQRFDAGNGNYFRLVFYKNGQGGDGYVHGHSIYRDNDGFNYVSLTITGLIQLDANDYVEAYAYSHNDTAWTLQRESQFFGYLVG